MGDRTRVTLTVLNEHVERAKCIIEDYDEDFPYSTHAHCFTFLEVNYGNLDSLPGLVAGGIPYESEWENGSEYTAGTQYCRFRPDGSVDITEVYDDQRNPNLKELMKLLDTPDRLIKAIQTHYESVTPLPWDNQAEYGKIYAARQLIEPKNY